MITPLTRNVTWYILSMLAILVSAQPGWASLANLTETGLGLKEGNYGATLAVNEAIQISAITHLGQSDGPIAGTLYLNAGEKGLGVQEPDAGGSKEISGSGGAQDEVIVFDFIQNVVASSLQVGLTCYKQSDDNPIITLLLSSGNELAFTDTHPNWNSALTSVGKEAVVVDLAVLLGQGFSGMVTGLTVAETEQHICVNSIAYEIPEPAMIALMGMGTLLLGVRRR